MLTIKIIIICLIIFELWFFQILYKNKWNGEIEANEDYMDRNFKWSQSILKDYEELLNDYAKLKESFKGLMEKNENITRELLSRDKKYNELLSEYNKLKNNRVAKIIKEEKIKHE